MLKIGEFSTASHLTIKTLRFYEKEGLLLPARVDPESRYRYYEPSQLETAVRIRVYRELGLSVDEVRRLLHSEDPRPLLQAKAIQLSREKTVLETRLFLIHSILEENQMNYQVTEKVIPGCICYYSECRLQNHEDILTVIPEMGRRCLELNPGLNCAEPAYEFCEYPNGDYAETDVLIRHNEAVTVWGKENDIIHFRAVPETRVLSILHQGPYQGIGKAYAFLLQYAARNGYTVNGLARECYLDGIWNKDTPEQWLTEIQLPIK